MIFRAEGNNGGDVFEICETDDGRICLKVGHCCVYEVDHIVPVEFLTSIIVRAVLDAGGVVEAIQAVDWPKDYVEQLVKQIQRR